MNINDKIIQILAHCSEASRLTRELEAELRPLTSLFANSERPQVIGAPAKPPLRIRKWRKLPEELREKVLNLRAAGRTLARCAVETGLSETSVNRIVAQAKRRK